MFHSNCIHSLQMGSGPKLFGLVRSIVVALGLKLGDTRDIFIKLILRNDFMLSGIYN